MADDEVTPLTTTTTNYGWTKPDVMGSDDAWGGMLNADLDGIDSVVHGIDARPPYVLPIASTTVLGGVKADGTTIHVAGDGTLSGTPSSGPPVTVSDTAPVGPQVGALWWDSVGGQLYTFFNDGNSSQWVIAVNAAASLLPASTTVLGGVKVDGTTIKAASDGTISTTVVPMGDNRIINGDMRIDQRNNGSSGTAQNVYTIDRWMYQASLASKGSWQRWTGDATALASGIDYALLFVSSSAYTPLAGDYFNFFQNIEADMVGDFAWGTASAKSVTLSFWATSSLSGTFGGVVANAAGTRSYPFTYSLTAGAWTKIAITIPGDTSGAWVLQGNAAAVHVAFAFGVGSTYSGPANVWASANYISANGAVNVVATNGAAFYVTGVKLEIGSVATPYNRQSLAKSMADCQRYFEIGIEPYLYLGSPFTSSAGYGSLQFQVAKRAQPTIATSNWHYFSAGVPTSCSVTAAILTVGSFGFSLTGATNWNGWDGSGTWTASAEL